MKNKKIATSDRKSSASKFPKKLLKQITTTKTWDSLVIDENSRKQLNNISTWIQDRNAPGIHSEIERAANSGSKVLFVGEGKTGKKLAAKLLGKHHSRDVYKVDLAGLFSKYIGETEENINKLFDAAEAKNWILFFDEADALFGKRTDVKDSHDKYASQKISYLNQRIKDHPGLVIVSSKNKHAADNAITGDFNTIIHFKKPA